MEPQSPFSTPPEPHDVTTPVPDEPRLGISHLLVLTACVAAYLGINRTFTLAMSSQAGLPATVLTFQTGVLGLTGVVSGAALAGLLLFVVRRFRGVSFPNHPGEYLLVMMGVRVVIEMATMPLYLLLGSLGHAQHLGAVYTVAAWFALAINGLVLVWVLIRVKVFRWRIFFLSIPAGYLLTMVMWWSGALSPGMLGFTPARTVTLLVLAVVLLKDHFDGRRYPWTHWFGVGTGLWFDAVTLVGVVWWIVAS